MRVKMSEIQKKGGLFCSGFPTANVLTVLLVATSSFFILGCDKNNLPEYTYLDRLRVLAISVDTPEVAPGANGVILRPLVSDPAGAGRTLTYTAEACVDPGVSFGNEPTCEGSPTLVALGTGPVTTLNVGNGYTNLAPALSLNMPDANVIFSGRSTAEQYNGLSYIVTYQVVSDSGVSTKAFKRILISTRQSNERNTNPQVSAVTLNGGEISANPTSDVDLAISYASDPRQTIVAMKSDGSTGTSTEEIIVTWFRSAGEFKYFRTDYGQTNLFKPPSLDGLTSLTLVVVASDTRGGIGIRQYQLSP